MAVERSQRFTFRIYFLPSSFRNIFRECRAERKKEKGELEILFLKSSQMVLIKLIKREGKSRLESSSRFCGFRGKLNFRIKRFSPLSFDFQRKKKKRFYIYI